MSNNLIQSVSIAEVKYLKLQQWIITHALFQLGGLMEMNGHFCITGF